VADNVQTTQYLYQFQTAGVGQTQQQFRQFINNLKQYEAQMRASMQQMDDIMRQTGAPRGTQYISQTMKDGRLASQELRRELEGVKDGLVTTQEQYNRFGKVIGAVNTATWTSADGIRRMHREIQTDATPGVAQLRSYRKEVIDNVTRTKEWTIRLNDNADTVIRAKEVFNHAGDSLGRFATVTKTTADGVRRTTTKISGMNKIMDNGSMLAGRFMRHLVWIGHGLLIWAAINTVSDAIRNWWQAQIDLNNALVEFEIRTQASDAQLDSFRQNILSVSAATAIAPGKIAAVAPYAPDEAALRYAAELNRVAGGDLQNQMQWLVAQQRQFGVAGEDTIRVLNALAAGYRLTTIPMDQYVTMLRDAAPLAQEFGLSMEEIYTLFGAMQSVTAAEGRELDYLSRNLSRLYDPSVAKQLGVQTTAVLPDLSIARKDMLTIMDELNEKIKSGRLSFEQLAEVMGATGRRQRQLLQAVVMGWDDVRGSMNAAMSEGGNFAEMLDTKMGSTQVKIDEVKQAWDALMIVMGDTGLVTKALDAVANGLNAWVGILERIDDLWVKIGLKAIEGEVWAQALFRIFLGTNALLGDTITPQAGATAGLGGGTIGRTFGARAIGGVWAGTGQPQELGRWPAMYNVPEGVSFAQVKASMDQWTEAFKALGPQFQLWVQQHQESALIYDENTKTIRQITGFLPALQRAISENTQTLKEQQLNVGLRTVDMNLDQSGGALRQWIQYYTEYLNRLGMPQEARPQLLVGLDDTFLRIWASNEALMLALRALTEATEDQTDALTGMWNVPEGATMWVPIQSLFYSRQRDTGGGGLPGQLPMPPATLPPPQQDWMGLPGAVEQMSVNAMTVHSFEGPPETAGKTDGKISYSKLVTPFIDSATSIMESMISKARSLLNVPGQPALNVHTPPYPAPWEQTTSMTIHDVKAGSIDLQSPTVDAVTPSLDAAVASATIMAGAGTSVNTPMVNLLAGGLTGITPVDMTTTEMLLSGMAQTLILIYNALSNLRSYPISGTPTRPGGVTIESGVISNDNLERFIDNRQYQVFRLQSRMKSPW